MIHTRYTMDYKVWEMKAKNGHIGGIAIVWREEAVQKVEFATKYGPNVVIFMILAGWKQWFIIGAYGTPNN